MNVSVSVEATIVFQRAEGTVSIKLLEERGVEIEFTATQPFEKERRRTFKHKGKVFLELFVGVDISRLSPELLCLSDLLVYTTDRAIDIWQFGGSNAAQDVAMGGSAAASVFENKIELSLNLPATTEQVQNLWAAIDQLGCG